MESSTAVEALIGSVGDPALRSCVEEAVGRGASWIETYSEAVENIRAGRFSQAFGAIAGLAGEDGLVPAAIVRGAVSEVCAVLGRMAEDGWSGDPDLSGFGPMLSAFRQKGFVSDAMAAANSVMDAMEDRFGDANGATGGSRVLYLYGLLRIGSYAGLANIVFLESDIGRILPMFDSLGTMRKGRRIPQIEGLEAFYNDLGTALSSPSLTRLGPADPRGMCVLSSELSDVAARYVGGERPGYEALLEVLGRAADSRELGTSPRGFVCRECRRWSAGDSLESWICGYCGCRTTYDEVMPWVFRAVSSLDMDLLDQLRYTIRPMNKDIIEWATMTIEGKMDNACEWIVHCVNSESSFNIDDARSAMAVMADVTSMSPSIGTRFSPSAFDDVIRMVPEGAGLVSDFISRLGSSGKTDSRGTVNVCKGLTAAVLADIRRKPREEAADEVLQTYMEVEDIVDGNRAAVVFTTLLDSVYSLIDGMTDEEYRLLYPDDTRLPFMHDVYDPSSYSENRIRRGVARYFGKFESAAPDPPVAMEISPDTPEMDCIVEELRRAIVEDPWDEVDSRFEDALSAHPGSWKLLAIAGVRNIMFLDSITGYQDLLSLVASVDIRDLPLLEDALADHFFDCIYWTAVHWEDSILEDRGTKLLGLQRALAERAGHSDLSEKVLDRLCGKTDELRGSKTMVHDVCPVIRAYLASSRDFGMMTERASRAAEVYSRFDLQGVVPAAMLEYYELLSEEVSSRSTTADMSVWSWDRRERVVSLLDMPVVQVYELSMSSYYPDNSIPLFKMRAEVAKVADICASALPVPVLSTEPSWNL